MAHTYHLLCMGRSSIDLFSNNIGSPFPKIESFSASVGGSSTNVCVGAQRLGLKTALLTAVGEDPVGEFILHFLRQEGVTTRYVAEKPGAPSSAVLMGIESPDRFPRVLYRENCADIQMDIDDVMAAPLADCQIFQFAGANLSQEPCRSATLMAAEKARRAKAKVVLDLDFRAEHWHDARAFGVAVRSALRLVDVVLAREDELQAVFMLDRNQMFLSLSQESDPFAAGDTARAIKTLLGMGPQALVLKVGAAGSQVHLKTGRAISVPGFAVEAHNLMGAGDAFAGGFLYGYAQGWEWQRAARLGNACGAIVVTKHGCANFMPTLSEVKAFMAGYGVTDV